MYTIEFAPAADAIRGHESDDMLEYVNHNDYRGIMELSPKPMTPRRVKRRSVMTRGTNGRHSTSSRRMHSNNRSSIRNSKKRIHQNPVTKILEEQQINTQSAYPSYMMPPPIIPPNPHSEAAALTVTNLQYLNKDYGDVVPASKVAAYQQITINPDPIYYNMNTSSPLVQQSWISANSSGVSNSRSNCHINPSYQHSTPNLSHSPEPEEPYHRPPSVRSSYSNFHGARPLSSYNPITENVFVNLADQSASQAIPQVPHRRSAMVQPTKSGINKNDQSRVDTGDRTMSFLRSGPPAYNLNYHTPPDSETTM